MTETLADRVAALELEVDKLRFPYATKPNYTVDRLDALETAVREFLATEDLGLIKVREAALEKLRDALK